MIVFAVGVGFKGYIRADGKVIPKTNTTISCILIRQLAAGSGRTAAHGHGGGR
jgi:hypothetical protein